MYQTLRQIIRTGIRTEPPPSPAMDNVVAQRLQEGIFGDSYATVGPLARLLPVDVAIPGCPPSPTALLQGILAAISTPPRSAPR